MIFKIISIISELCHLCRKSVIEILNWKIHYWMEARPHVLRYVILATQRYYIDYIKDIA